MTPKHPYINCPTLPFTTFGGVFLFLFRQFFRWSAVPAGRNMHSVAKNIHNMNAFNCSKKVRVHIMNFLAHDKKQSGAIHIMNFINSRVEPRSVRRKLDGPGVTGAPLTYEGARNVMSQIKNPS